MIRLLTPFVMAVALVSGAACRKAPAPGTQAQAGQAPGSAAPATAGAQPAELPMPPKPFPPLLPDVLARVNGVPVQKHDFDRLIKNMEATAGQPLPPERRDDVYRKALDQLITYNVLSQEAKARNIQVTDAEIEEQMKRMRGQFPSEEEFKKALASRGTTAEEVRADSHADIGINKMMEAEVANVPGASDAEVKDFYAKNPDKFKQPEAVRASHILIQVPEAADAAAKKAAHDKAERVLKEAKSGTDFAALAKKYSADGSASQGGDLNFFARGQMVPPFEQAAFALKPGQISGIVTTQFGYHIIKVTELRPASTVPYDQVAPRVREYLTEQKKQEHGNSFIEGLKKKSKIEVLV